MARKSAAKLKDGPVTLSPDAEAHLDKLAQATVYPGCERYFEAYLSSVRASEEQHVRVAAFGDDFGSNDPRWPDFMDAAMKLEQLNLAQFQRLDAWKRAEEIARKEETRRADPTQSTVDKEEAKVLISESLAESAAELQWNLKSVGLVAHKLTDAVFGFVVREESQDPPLCDACA